MKNMDLLNEIDCQLKRLRLSRAWAARRVDCTYNHFVQVMNGGHNLSKEMRTKLADLNDKLKSVVELMAV